MQATSQTMTAGARTDVSAAGGNGSRKTYARWIGAAFLVGFLVYGGGLSLVTSVVSTPDFMANIASHETALIAGAFLMLLVTITDIGKGVLFFPILENHGKRTAVVYLAAIVVQVVFLNIGALFVLMLIPLGQIAADAGASASWAPGVGTLLAESNTIAYNVGQAILCFGGVFLCILLFRTRLIPRALAGLGVAGYVLHAAGSVSEIFGLPLSLVLLIPGGIFEVGIAFWLIIKGFQPAAVAKGFGAPIPVDQPAGQVTAAAGVSS
jgi:Domain of unknown function (DUF4386)